MAVHGLAVLFFRIGLAEVRTDCKEADQPLCYTYIERRLHTWIG